MQVALRINRPISEVIRYKPQMLATIVEELNGG